MLGNKRGWGYATRQKRGGPGTLLSAVTLIAILTVAPAVAQTPAPRITAATQSRAEIQGQSRRFTHRLLRTRPAPSPNPL
jgi:hypothetical protein